MNDPIVLVLYILVGAVAGMIYGLRRVFILERKIDNIEKIIAVKLGAVKKKR